MADQTDNGLHDRSIAELLKQLDRRDEHASAPGDRLSKAELTQKIETVRHELQDKREIASHDLPELFGQARQEVKQSGKRAGSALALVAAAAMIALFGLGGLTAFFILALGGAMPDWAAALIVAAVYLAVAVLLLIVGRRRLREATPLISSRLTGRIRSSAKALFTPSQTVREAVSPVPAQTIATLKEDVEWAKHPTRSAAK